MRNLKTNQYLSDIRLNTNLQNFAKRTPLHPMC